MIDLHMHTTYSDGEFSLIELLKLANRSNLTTISITDHDTIKAYDELKSIEYKKYFNGKIINGCEIKCICNDKPIEILAYRFNIEKLRNIKALNLNMIEKQEKYLQYLIKQGKTIGIDIDAHIDPNNNAYASFIYQKEIEKNPKYIEILKENGIELIPHFYRAAQTNPKTIFYIDEKKDFVGAKELINDIHRAGGLAFLAHSYIYGYEDILDMIDELKEYGLDGIECYYSTFTEEQTKILEKKAEQLKLLKSGGTDFHGKAKSDIKLGIGRGNLNISEEIIKDWKPG